MLNWIRFTLLALLTSLTGVAHAQAMPAWPSKPIKIVVPGAPGGPPDRFSRHYGEHLSRLLNTPVIIENRPGAAGNLAVAAVAGSNDQHTLLYGFSSIFGINPHLYPKTSVDPWRDLMPIATTLRQGLLLVVNPQFPAQNFEEFLRVVRGSPVELNYASYGMAGYPHLAMEVLQSAAKIQLNHVPYKQKAIVDVIGGQIPILFELYSTALPQVRGNTVRALAYTGGQRRPELPMVPTLEEVLPGFGEVWGTHGIWMAAGTPAEVIRRLAEAIEKITALPETRALITTAGAEPLPGDGARLASITRDEFDRWGKIIKEKGIKPE